MPHNQPLGPRITDAQIAAAIRDLAAIFDNLEWRSGDTFTITVAALEAAIQQRGHSLACVRQLFSHLRAEGVFTRVELYEHGTTHCWGRWEQEVTPGETIPHFSIAYDAWHGHLAGGQQAAETSATITPTERETIAIPNHPLTNPGPRLVENPNGPRDKFIYDNLANGKSRAWIRNRINNRSSWEPLDTEQGVSAAARRYALRHRLSWPINREV
jgi:hypothetical protein